MSTVESRTERTATALALAVGLGALLRLANAWTASFHLDDFHSLHHARAESWGVFLRVLAQDNHPPLSFALLRVVRGLLGEGELVLRLTAVACGVALLPLTWRLAGFLGRGAAVRLAATLLVAVSSLHVELSSDARMYSLLALCAAGWTEAVLTRVSSPSLARSASLRLVLWTAAGLLTHYHFLHALFVGCLALGALALLRPGERRATAGVAGAVALGALLASPWYIWGFRTQLGHGLAPGGSTVSLTKLGESYVHMLFHGVRQGGPVLRWLFLGLGALAVLGALDGLVRAVRRARADGSWAAPVLFGALAFALPAWTALAATISPRAGYEWRYLAASIAPFATLLALQADAGRLRRAATVAVIAGGLGLVACGLGDPGREDYEGGIRSILARAQPTDAVVAADWQPRLFPHGGAWHYYAPRLATGELPVLLEHDDDFALAPGVELGRFPRVFTLLRSIPNQVGFLRQLRAEFPHEEKRLFGESVWVLVFSREPGATGG